MVTPGESWATKTHPGSGCVVRSFRWTVITSLTHGRILARETFHHFLYLRLSCLYLFPLSFSSFLDARLFPTSLSLRLPWYLIFPAQRNIIIDCTVSAGHDWVVEGVFYLPMSLERVQVNQRGGVRAAANSRGRGMLVSG